MLIVSDIEGEMQLTAKVKRSLIQQLGPSCVPAYCRNVDVKNMLGIEGSEPLICCNNIFLCSTDIFLPTPDSLLVNLNECKEVGTLIKAM